MSQIVEQYIKTLHKNSLEECSLSELEKLCNQYPYWEIPKIVAIKKSEKENREAYKNYLKNASLYFSNPHWLNFIIHEDDYENGLEKFSEIKTNPAKTFISAPSEPIEHFNTTTSTKTPKIFQPSENTIEPIKPEENIDKNKIEELEILPTENLAIHQTENNLVEEKIIEEELKLEVPEILPNENLPIHQTENNLDVENVKEENIIEEKIKDTTDDVKEFVLKIPSNIEIVENEPIENSPSEEQETTTQHWVDEKFSSSPEPTPELNTKKSFLDWINNFSNKNIDTEKIAETKIESTDIEELNHEEENNFQEEHYDKEQVISTSLAGDIITETMAKIWMQQGKYGKAVDIYQKLCLLFPEKKPYFAAKIKEIKNIKL